MKRLKEADVLRIRLADMAVALAQQEKAALLEKLCLVYKINPSKEGIDLGTGYILPKPAPENV